MNESTGKASVGLFLCYDDPLAAAWMAKHFGMKLQYLEYYPSGKRIEDISLDRINAIAGRHGLDSYQLSKLYIHPDSVLLLKPKVSDLIRSVDANCDHAVFRLFKPEDDTGIWQEDWFRIIQRNGVPFHWPESEAA